jgi:hypothetical protein
VWSSNRPELSPSISYNYFSIFEIVDRASRPLIPLAQGQLINLLSRWLTPLNSSLPSGSPALSRPLFSISSAGRSGEREGLYRPFSFVNFWLVVVSLLLGSLPNAHNLWEWLAGVGDSGVSVLGFLITAIVFFVTGHGKENLNFFHPITSGISLVMSIWLVTSSPF